MLPLRTSIAGLLRCFAVTGVCAAYASLSRPLYAQPVPFVATTIDGLNSGDCKAIGDIDGDGRGDPIVGGSTLCWYEAGASFAKRIILDDTVHGEFTTDCQATDLDADGDIDIVIGDGGGTNNLLWFENPRLSTPPGLGSDPRIPANWVYHFIGTHGDTVHDIEVGDLDSDGRLEVVSSGHDRTHIWKLSGSTWLHKDIGSLAGVGVFIGDIDRDGFSDIATPFAWIKNPGSVLGTWTRFPINGATSGDECLLVDLNKDNRLDLLTCDAHVDGQVYWFEQPSNPTSPAWVRRSIDSSMGAHHPEAMDFNLDGRIDLLLGLELSDVAVYLNQPGSPPSFTKQVVASTGGHNARAGDIDGDTLPDILTCDYITNPPVRIYINDLPDPNTPCYANCDKSPGEPVLTANDFVCFLASFAQGSSSANCDGSVVDPILNANDFVCFATAFAGGCS